MGNNFYSNYDIIFFLGGAEDLTFFILSFLGLIGTIFFGLGMISLSTKVRIVITVIAIVILLFLFRIIYTTI